MHTEKLLKKFQEIYDETYNNTIKYIICKCKNLNDVDDIIQETYLEMYKALKDKKNILNYQTYIISIAKNKIFKYFNENKKQNTVSIFQEVNEEEIMIDIEAGIDIESEIISKDNIDSIWNYIKSLDTKVAKIFYLHFIKNMTFKEISEKLDIKESTIKSILYRMLKNVKKFYLGGVKNEK